MDEAMAAYIAAERALRAGDVDGAHQAIGDPDGWSNVLVPYTGVPEQALALGWAPPAAVRRLLDPGADPNFRVADDGFPALVNVIHHRRREEGHPILVDLLAAGARVDERGLNDLTALHFAASYDDEVAVRLLLRAGADS